MKKIFLGLGRDIVAYGIMEGISKATGFLLLAIFTRLFTLEEFGIVEIVATLTNLVTMIISLALPSAVARYFVFYKNIAELENNRNISSILVFMIFFGIIILILGIILSNNFSKLLLNDSQYKYLIVLSFFSAFFLALSNISNIVLRMERRIVRANLINFIFSISYESLALYFVFFRSLGLKGVLIASVLASLFQFLLSVIWIKSKLTLRLSIDHLLKSLKYSLPMFPAIIVNWINQQANRFILLTFLGLIGVGIYGAAVRIGMAVGLLTIIFQRAWNPYAMSLLESPEKERNLFYQHALNYFAGIFACIALALTVSSPEIFKVLLPEEYLNGYMLIPWIAGAAILHISGSMTNIGVLISERTYANSIAAGAGTTINIVLAVCLIPLIGIMGAAIGTFVAEFLFTSILLYYSVHNTNIRFHYYRLIVIIITYILTSVTITWVTMFIHSQSVSLMIRFILFVFSAIIILNQSLDEPARRSIRSDILKFTSRIKQS